MSKQAATTWRLAALADVEALDGRALADDPAKLAVFCDGHARNGETAGIGEIDAQCGAVAWIGTDAAESTTAGHSHAVAGPRGLEHVRDLEGQGEVRGIRGQADAEQGHQGGVLVQRVGHA
ncbi:hypothetical protein G6F46_013759 [Rhizopus delemar]|nr:hypothetical protein G6F46_013759 [Rhizopus delemar]